MNKDLNPVPRIEPPQGGVMALGNFDGVHRGHQAVIAVAMKLARQQGLSAHVLTFEPHPRSLFQPQHSPFRLTPAAAKRRLLLGLGVAEVLVQDFSESFAHLTALEFIEKILVKHYGVRHVVAGEDFTFGHKRGGSMALLRETLAVHGVGVTQVAPCQDASGLVLSSSRVRSALQQGDLATARGILGRPWAITGAVQRGAQRGRTLGFPTANLGLGEHLRPAFGAYAIRARRVEDGRSSYSGVANIGTRPTVDGVTESLEFHLFDFSEDIYGEAWEVELHHYLRPEQSFANLEALKAQIVKDAAQARELLADA